MKGRKLLKIKCKDCAEAKDRLYTLVTSIDNTEDYYILCYGEGPKALRIKFTVEMLVGPNAQWKKIRYSTTRWDSAHNEISEITVMKAGPNKQLTPALIKALDNLMKED